MNVRGWLEGLGLGQYADAFDANHIDAQLLRGLAGDDLRELGVASLGHRKRLLDAIANLREDAPAAAREAEHRQVADAISQALVDVHDVLTPAQRKAVADYVRAHRRGHWN